jgi:hypothetical protein
VPLLCSYVVLFYWRRNEHDLDRFRSGGNWQVTDVAQPECVTPISRARSACPAHVIDGRNLDVSGGVDMCAPRRDRVDCFRRREFGETT